MENSLAKGDQLEARNPRVSCIGIELEEGFGGWFRLELGVGWVCTSPEGLGHDFATRKSSENGKTTVLG